MDIMEIILKMFLAVGLGGLIGLERETSHKPAGLRTNILICLGSTLMMILSQIALQGKEGPTGDSLRIAAGVITGIGFIGAGTIIQARGVVHGLTTASTLWAVAGLGLAIGAGYYVVACLFTGFVLLTLILFRKIEDFHLRKGHLHYQLRIKDAPQVLVNLRKLAFHLGVKMEGFLMKKDKDELVVGFTLTCPEDKEERFNQGLLDLGEILEFKID